MTAPNWFAARDAVRHTIHFPGTLEVAAYRRRNGEQKEQVDAFLVENSIWVELRELSAGDRARMEELRFTQQGEGKLDFGETRMMTVQLCLVGWSLPEPITPQTISELNPLVFDAIFAAIPDGRLIPPDATERANGSGPPPQAADELPVIEAKDTTRIT